MTMTATTEPTILTAQDLEDLANPPEPDLLDPTGMGVGYNLNPTGEPDTLGGVYTPEPTTQAIMDRKLGDKLWIGLREYAELIGLSYEHVRGMHKAGTLGIPPMRRNSPNEMVRLRTADIRMFWRG